MPKTRDKDEMQLVTDIWDRVGGDASDEEPTGEDPGRDVGPEVDDGDLTGGRDGLIGWFNQFRRSRPFWAGGLAMVGALIILVFPFLPIKGYVTAGFSNPFGLGPGNEEVAEGDDPEAECDPLFNVEEDTCDLLGNDAAAEVAEEDDDCFVGCYNVDSRLQMLDEFPVGQLPGLLLLGVGFLTWMAPRGRKLFGIVAMVAAVLAFYFNHLGGLVVGMLLGIVGGAMAFAWDPAPRAGGARAREAAEGDPDEEADTLDTRIRENVEGLAAEDQEKVSVRERIRGHRADVGEDGPDGSSVAAPATNETDDEGEKKKGLGGLRERLRRRSGDDDEEMELSTDIW